MFNKDTVEYFKDNKMNTLNWKKEYLNFICCDCGLTHRIEFNVIGDMLFFKLIALPEESEDLRDQGFGTLQGDDSYSSYELTLKG